MQVTSSRIWTRFEVFIFFDDDNYIKSSRHEKILIHAFKWNSTSWRIHTHTHTHTQRKVIYEALCFDVAQGWMNRASNETNSIFQKLV